MRNSWNKFRSVFVSVIKVLEGIQNPTFPRIVHLPVLGFTVFQAGDDCWGNVRNGPRSVYGSVNNVPEGIRNTAILLRPNNIT